jgi:putative glutamine amidotransferase
MKIAIIERIENYDEDKPFNKRYYLDNWFRKIFDELGILLIPVISEKNLEEIANMCDGLVVTGSANDVHPKYYGEEPIKEYKFDEYGLVKNIIELFSNANKPILGICAGIQEINVVFGGTLYQQIPNHNLKDQSQHKIKITDNSFLYDVYKENQIEVNSYHKQAVKDLAPNFKITAMSEDGIIEGIEKDNIVAVQWHPEVLFDMKIFKCFIEKFFNK